MLVFQFIHSFTFSFLSGVGGGEDMTEKSVGIDLHFCYVSKAYG